MEEIDEDGSGLVEFDEYWEWWMKGVTKIRWPWRMALLCGGLGAGPVVTAWQYWHRSHLLDVVERVCDRMAVLERGRLAGIGSLDELRATAGSEGTLEQVFGTLARTEDPAEQARRLLGS